MVWCDNNEKVNKLKKKSLWPALSLSLSAQIWKYKNRNCSPTEHVYNCKHLRCSSLNISCGSFVTSQLQGMCVSAATALRVDAFGRPKFGAAIHGWQWLMTKVCLNNWHTGPQFSEHQSPEIHPSFQTSVQVTPLLCDQRILFLFSVCVCEWACF